MNNVSVLTNFCNIFSSPQGWNLLSPAGECRKIAKALG